MERECINSANQQLCTYIHIHIYIYLKKLKKGISSKEAERQVLPTSFELAAVSKGNYFVFKQSTEN